MKGHDGFYTDNVANYPDNVKYEAEKKLKFLVWYAISELLLGM